MPPISFELATRVGFLACAGQKRDSSLLSPSSHSSRWGGSRWRPGSTWRRCPCRFPGGQSRPGWVEPSARYSVVVGCHVDDAAVVGAQWVHAGPSLLSKLELELGVETLTREPASLASGGWLSRAGSAPWKRKKLASRAAGRWTRWAESLGWRCCLAEWQGRM